LIPFGENCNGVSFFYRPPEQYSQLLPKPTEVFNNLDPNIESIQTTFTISFISAIVFSQSFLIALLLEIH